MGLIEIKQKGGGAIHLKIELPHEVAVIIDKLENAGYEGYIVGGCVRDSIIGVTPHDWDICTNALPEQVTAVFKGYKIIPTGIKHGTVSVQISDKLYEITTYRIDGRYTDGRRPDSVEFTTDIVQDLSRRDFTINAMAYNPRTGLVDPFGGKDDIEAKVIKCVGNPEDRFKEDALRMLRAIRFSATLEFTLDKSVDEAITRLMPLLKNVSNERISSEITKILQSEGAIMPDSFRLLSMCWCYLINPKVDIPEPWLFSQNRWNLYITSFPDLRLRLAILLYFYDSTDIKNGAEKLKRLRFDAKTVSDVQTILDTGLTIHCETAYSMPTCSMFGNLKIYAKHIMSKVGYELGILSATFAVNMSPTMSQNKLQNIITIMTHMSNTYVNHEPYRISDLNIDGNDIISLGITGKQVGECLDKLLDLVIIEKLSNTHEQLMMAAKKVVNEI